MWSRWCVLKEGTLSEVYFKTVGRRGVQEDESGWKYGDLVRRSTDKVSQYPSTRHGGNSGKGCGDV